MWISGEFETHLTVRADEAGEAAAFAAAHGLKLLAIELDRGAVPVQPMLTLRGSGTLGVVTEEAWRWALRMAAVGIAPQRIKIEATPWSTGVPQDDDDAAPAKNYFEHHIKLRLGAGQLTAATEVAGRHEARLSRNARQVDGDGAHQRFVNQRCPGVHRGVATARLDPLVADLRAAGLEIVSVEQEYVAYDTALELDRGWLTEHRPKEALPAPAWAPGYPETYRPLAEGWARQHRVFDPALKAFSDGFRAGEPVFDDLVAGERWRAARHAAMLDVLRRVALSRFNEHLVLRGSVTMAAWIGVAARTPGDLDFVVTPASITSGSAEARSLLDGIVAATGARDVAESAIWTYERADGRRLMIPFGGRGIPDGALQIDVVFGERLPLAPAPLDVPGVGVPVLAATASLSLAWKLLWLATDMWPQGKDLYDAVLLAEHTTVDLDLVRDLMRPELGAEAGAFGPESVLDRSFVDWDNFLGEYPFVTGTVTHWLLRLATALSGERAGGAAQGG